MSGKYLPFGMYQFNLLSKRSSVTIPLIIKIFFMNFRYAQFNFTNVHIDFTDAQINLTYAQSNFTSKSNTVTHFKILAAGARLPTQDFPSRTSVFEGLRVQCSENRRA